MIDPDFQLEDLARNLTERAVDVYHLDGLELILRWYHSGSDCDLMVWLDSENQLVRFQFNVTGQIVDWNRLAGFKTGLIVETEHTQNGSMQSELMSEMINYDKEVSPRAIELAERILLAAREVKAPWREKMVRLLASSGPQVRGQAVREARPRFWKRFRQWVAG
jgi:hypothetical protein